MADNCRLIGQFPWPGSASRLPTSQLLPTNPTCLLPLATDFEFDPFNHFILLFRPFSPTDSIIFWASIYIRPSYLRLSNTRYPSVLHIKINIIINSINIIFIFISHKIWKDSSPWNVISHKLSIIPYFLFPVLPFFSQSMTKYCGSELALWLTFCMGQATWWAAN